MCERAFLAVVIGHAGSLKIEIDDSGKYSLKFVYPWLWSQYKELAKLGRVTIEDRRAPDRSLSAISSQPKKDMAHPKADSVEAFIQYYSEVYCDRLPGDSPNDKPMYCFPFYQVNDLYEEYVFHVGGPQALVLLDSFNMENKVRRVKQRQAIKEQAITKRAGLLNQETTNDQEAIAVEKASVILGYQEKGTMEKTTGTNDDEIKDKASPPDGMIEYEAKDIIESFLEAYPQCCSLSLFREVVAYYADGKSTTDRIVRLMRCKGTKCLLRH
jgi:hypothetical protein